MDQNASAPATRPAPPAAAAAAASDDDEDVESASENSGDELQQHNVPATKRDDVSDKSPGLPDNYNNNVITRMMFMVPSSWFRAIVRVHPVYLMNVD